MKKYFYACWHSSYFFVHDGMLRRFKIESEKPVTLSMWHIYGEQTDSPLNQLVQEFNATVGKEKGSSLRLPI